MILKLDGYNKWVGTKRSEFWQSDDRFEKYFDFDNKAVSVCDFKTQRFETAEQKEIPEGTDIPMYDVMLAIAWAKLNNEEIPTLDTEPQRWRADECETYYFIDDCLDVEEEEDCYDCSMADQNRYKLGNYFKTEERASEVAEKIKFLLKLEQLHDMYCPEYKPNWKKSDELKYTIYYSVYNNCYYILPTSASYLLVKTTVYFPTKDVAQKVCDILNEELKENNE